MAQYGPVRSGIPKRDGDFGGTHHYRTPVRLSASTNKTGGVPVLHPSVAGSPEQQKVPQIRAVDEAVTSEILGAPGIAPRLKQLGEVGAVDEPIAVEVALTRLQAI